MARMHARFRHYALYMCTRITNPMKTPIPRFRQRAFSIKFAGASARMAASRLKHDRAVLAAEPVINPVQGCTRHRLHRTTKTLLDLASLKCERVARSSCELVAASMRICNESITSTRMTSNGMARSRMRIHTGINRCGTPLSTIPTSIIATRTSDKLGEASFAISVSRRPWNASRRR